jgi:hypothetical protein
MALLSSPDTGFGRLHHPAFSSHSPELALGEVERAKDPNKTQKAASNDHVAFDAILSAEMRGAKSAKAGKTNCR